MHESQLKDLISNDRREADETPYFTMIQLAPLGLSGWVRRLIFVWNP
jgi:hypothetical protein